jgi:hypothetical protein
MAKIRGAGQDTYRLRKTGKIECFAVLQDDWVYTDDPTVRGMELYKIRQLNISRLGNININWRIILTAKQLAQIVQDGANLLGMSAADVFPKKKGKK